MRIRRATCADLARILKIERQSFGREAWNRESFEDYAEYPRETYFVVGVLDGKVAGYAVAVELRGGAEIDSIAVLPSKRRYGVGRALLAAVLKHLRRKGNRAVTLMVRRNNAAAIGLYREFGFQRVRRINNYYPDGGAAWRMRAELQ